MLFFVWVFRGYDLFDLVLIVMFEGLFEKRNIVGWYEKCFFCKLYFIFEYLRYRWSIFIGLMLIGF